MKKMAILYDFDYTLAQGNAPDFGLFQKFEMTSAEFFNEADSYRIKERIGNILGYLYYVKRIAETKKIPLTRKFLNNAGQDVQFYNGVEEWFDRINKFGQENGVEIEHYIISSGIKEIIDGCKIAKYFKAIFGSEYHYKEDGTADWLACAVDYTNKTQYVYRINKGVLDICDDETLNGYMAKDKRAVPIENMVYLGDGWTDVPCMKAVGDKGGVAIAVYSDRNLEIAKKLFESGRATCITLADYSENSQLDKTVKDIIIKIKNT